MAIATSDERYFVDLVNDVRKGLGLSTLQIEKHLNTAADRHNAWMLDADVFSHTGVSGSSPSERIKAAGFPMDGESWGTGENIAYVSIDNDGDLRDEIRTLHQNLLNSPGHYANIVRPEFALIGIGLSVGEFEVNGRGYQVLMATQNFGRTTGTPDLDIPAGPVIPVPENPEVEAPEIPDFQTRADWLDASGGGNIIGSTQDGSPAEGTSVPDDFRLGNGFNIANGHDANDWISGGSATDILHGGAGDDGVEGGAGNDVLIGGAGNDALFGGAGHDTINGGQGDDVLIGGAGHDVLRGGAGNDWLEGGAGSDLLIGGAGQDTLHGGAGNDILTGGAGDDTFVFEERNGQDVITDFEEGDEILISQAALGGSIEDLVSAMRLDGDDVVIRLEGSGSIRVTGDGLTIQNVLDDIFVF